MTFTFRSSARLATAYGVAVTGTFLITTALLLVVARIALALADLAAGRWSGVVFGGRADLLRRQPDQGHPRRLADAAHRRRSSFTVMMTWQRGRRDRHRPPASSWKARSPTSSTSCTPRESSGCRAPPSSRIPTRTPRPLALRANVAHNHVLHERVVIISGRTANVPHIPWEERLTVDAARRPETTASLHIAAAFGFQDPTDFPEVLRRAAAATTPPAGPPTSTRTRRRTSSPGSPCAAPTAPA